MLFSRRALVNRDADFVSIDARIEGTIRGLLVSTADRSGVIGYAQPARTGRTQMDEDNRVG